jgi:hypothetical protein
VRGALFCGRAGRADAHQVLEPFGGWGPERTTPMHRTHNPRRAVGADRFWGRNEGTELEERKTLSLCMCVLCASCVRPEAALRTRSNKGCASCESNQRFLRLPRAGPRSRRKQADRTGIWRPEPSFLGSLFSYRYTPGIPVPSAEISRANGQKSNGAKTAGGKLARALAPLEHGIRSWNPCLPGETEEDWTHLLEGCSDSLRPVGVLEEELVYQIAITLLQTRRLHRREREISLEHMKVDCFSPLEKEHVQEQVDAILEDRGAELRLETTILDNLITTLGTLPNDPAEMPLEDEAAKQLLDWIIGVNVSQKHLRKGEVIITMPPQGWTVGSVLEAVSELADAVGKTPEVVIANTTQQVTEERDGKREKLKTAWHYVEHDSLPKPETAALLNLYDRRLLNNLTRLYNLLERMQGARLGRPLIPTVPVDVTITHDGNGEG